MKLQETTGKPQPISEFLDSYDQVYDAIWLDGLQVQKPSKIHQRSTLTPHSAVIDRHVKYSADAEPREGWPAYSIAHPGPDLAKAKTINEGRFFGGPAFAIWLQQGNHGPVCRPIRPHELLQCFQLDAQDFAHLSASDVIQLLRPVPGPAGLAYILFAIKRAEELYLYSQVEAFTEADKLDYIDSRTPLYNFVLDPATTLPLPSNLQWQEATVQDQDLAHVYQQLIAREPANLALLTEKSYSRLMEANQLEADDGILYYYERSKTERCRQLRVKVVPVSLRHTVLAACHSSPFGGHSGIKRTLYRMSTRFFWPGMVRDITIGVKGCAHCRLANHASHEAQIQLQTLACDTPFDVVFLDLWSPGKILDKDRNVQVLTFVDCMTGFAAATFLRETSVNSHGIAMAAFAAFFIPFGLPRLIIVDDDPKFKATFQQLFRALQVPVQPVAPENHKAIRNERFHRYLNKVQGVNSADTGTLEQWKQGTLFAIYAWNAGPIDGTDIPRSVAAIARDFPFPIDLSNAVPRHGAAEGQQALDHFEALSPLLYKQRQLLVILNAERRQRHNELRNEGMNTPTFDAGDLVIVRKQVKSDAAAGVSAKLIFKSKGPYRVIERIDESNSYKLQKLPFLQGMGVPGRIVKENAARMEKLPSTLVLHKRTDGADSRFAAMHRGLSRNPLSKWLGIPRYGAFQPANEEDTMGIRTPRLHVEQRSSR